MIWRMDEFDTDYSFLNLPEAGSAVRGPIELPSIEPIDFDLFGGPPPADDTGEDDGGAEGSGIFQRQPIRERGNDQARFEMGRAIGQEVNTLRQNIQTLEAAKGELVSERDDAIQMQDQIRQQMSEQRIQELNQQQAQLQAELQEAVAAAEARGIDALAEAEAQAAEELASVSANFQSQIDALTGERDQAIAEQDMIRAEAAEQQVQALEAQKQNYESQLAEMTGQTTQRDQTIADLQAQLEGLQQAPAVSDTSLLDARRQELQDIGYDAADVEEILERDQQRGLENVTSNVLPDMIGKTPPVIPPRPPQLPPKRGDQLFISDQPRFISEERSPLQQAFDKIQGSIKPIPVPPGQEGQLPIAPVNTGPITIMGTTLSQEDSDRIRAGSAGGLKGIVNRASERLKNNPNTIRRGGFLNRAGTPATTSPKGPLGIGGPLSAVSRATTTPSPQMSGAFLQRQVRPPQAPAITPPRRPMSVGGIGGMDGRMNRMMVR